MNHGIDGLRVKPLRVIPDDRGWLTEILRSDDPDFRVFGQVYLTAVYPGVIKAWHYHKHQTDFVACVRGMIRLGLYDPRDDSPTKGMITELFIGDLNPCLVVIPPLVMHGFQALGSETALVINVPDKLYNYENPDEFRVRIDDPSVPFIWEIRNR
ncbi:MAG: dTDP-4-dehydrorhamnose 3,5-epimerase family protein [candidate division WOR-3 bacterium]